MWRNNYQDTDYYAALICNSQQFQTPTDATITAYNWELQDFQNSIDIQPFPLYSTLTNQLYTITGTEIHKLSFTNKAYFTQDNQEWKWEKLDTKIPNDSNLDAASAVMTKDKCLFVVGDSPAVNIFEVDNDKWISAQSRLHASGYCGIYYNEPNDVIYVGGGFGFSNQIACNKMEYYSLEKDVWNALPDTNKGHDMYPLIWLEDNNNLLYIMSISSNCIEPVI